MDPDQFFLQNGAQLRGYARRLLGGLGGEEAVENLVREVEAQGRARWTTIQNPEAWSFHALHNLIRNYLRARRRRRDRGVLDAGELLDNLPDGTDPTATAIAFEDLQSALGSCVNRLAARLREIFTLRIFDEKTFQEIVNETSSSLGTVFRLFDQAREQIRNCLNENGWEIRGSD